MELTGIIQFLPFATGTKSESVRPYLVDESGNKTLIFKKNDNPFMNNFFTPLDGKTVCVMGEYSNNAFVVETVRELPCDAEKNQDAADVEQVTETATGEDTDNVSEETTDKASEEISENASEEASVDVPEEGEEK